MNHSRWKTLRERKLAEEFTEPDDVAEARQQIALSMALARAVYERRTELALTQTELAARAGLTQAKISRIEAPTRFPRCLSSPGWPRPWTPRSISPSMMTTHR